MDYFQFSLANGVVRRAIIFKPLSHHYRTWGGWWFADVDVSFEPAQWRFLLSPLFTPEVRLQRPSKLER